MSSRKTRNKIKKPVAELPTERQAPNKIIIEMDGIKLNCNIYTFENAENYISRLEPFDEKSGVCCHKVNEIIQEIKKEFPNAKGCQVDSKYYAAGIYGCIGRLSKVTVLDSEWNSNGKSFYIYF